MRPQDNGSGSRKQAMTPPPDDPTQANLPTLFTCRAVDVAALDPHVWWWKGMTQMIDQIPMTTSPIVETAVMRLANRYWRDGFLPGSVVKCARLIGYDPRTLRKHWPEVVELLLRYGGAMIEDRLQVVAARQKKIEAGRKGGAANVPQVCRTFAASVHADREQFQPLTETRDRDRVSNRFPREDVKESELDDIPF